MDDAAFGLNECQRVFFSAGIRYMFRPPSDNISRETFQEARVDDLPKEFRKLLENTEPGCTTLWTYAELGQDLMGLGSANRSRVLKQLIQALAWPKGSICFWPFTLWKDESLLFQPDIFLLGLHTLVPRAIVYFESQSVQNNISFHEQMVSVLNLCDVSHVSLPDFHEFDRAELIDPRVLERLQSLKDSLS
ncbi:hypothetical protein JCM15519_23940 [Fundidesulfovibrio butyratiphilus]